MVPHWVDDLVDGSESPTGSELTLQSAVKKGDGPEVASPAPADKALLTGVGVAAL
jgi:hypothetical protein